MWLFLYKTVKPGIPQIIESVCNVWLDTTSQLIIYVVKSIIYVLTLISQIESVRPAERVQVYKMEYAKIPTAKHQMSTNAYNVQTTTYTQ